MEDNKIKKEINNVVNDNLKALEQLFPSAVKDGQLDIKALKEELGEFEEVTAERYELNWSGKQNAKKMVQQGIGNKTLKFVEKDSKNADTTENIYIEGDNLEVLKLLRQNYYNSIKMIYIDPPYNTGNDFVYNDDFSMSKEKSDIAEGIISENNEKLQKNQKSTNRYHANWLNMMYPRLKLARDLLTDDGVIFISIDEYEISNLMNLCNEIYGNENYIENFIWIKNSTKNLSKTTSTNHEYILCYSKNKNILESKNIFRIEKPGLKEVNQILERANKEKWSVEKTEEKLNVFYKTRKDLKGISNYNKVEFRKNKNSLSEQTYCLVYTLSDMSAPKSTGKAETYDVIHPITGLLCKCPSSGWRFTQETMKKHIENDLIYFYDDETHVPRFKRFLDTVTTEVMKSVINNYTDGKKELINLFDKNAPFDNAKPTTLLKDLIQILEKEDIILDFFSGSATTAHAVMQLNSEDDGNRKYIMVQLPETTDEKSEAFKSGYKNIAEIGKERIRRAGEKIKQEVEEYNSKLKLGEEPKKVPDIGFKVFKVDDTNIKWYDMDNLNENNQYSFDDPDSLDFVVGSNDIDIVYEIMLRQNDVPLSESLEALTDIGNRTYLYASSYLICLETEITEEMVEKLASLEPLPIKFVFRDSAFKDNISLKDETFRRLRSLIERNSGESKVSYRVEFI